MAALLGVGAYLAWSQSGRQPDWRFWAGASWRWCLVWLSNGFFATSTTATTLDQVLLTFGLIYVFEEMRPSRGATTCMA